MGGGGEVTGVQRPFSCGQGSKVRSSDRAVNDVGENGRVVTIGAIGAIGAIGTTGAIATQVCSRKRGMESPHYHSGETRLRELHAKKTITREGISRGS